MSPSSRLALLALLFAACSTPTPRPAPLTPPMLAAPTTPPDRDGDGVPDAVDRCPDSIEDCDGVSDDDGCPDLDDDHDGVPDVCDACPGGGGEMVGPDGCQQSVVLLRLDGTQLWTAQPVSFDANRAVLSPGAASVLDLVSSFLQGSPHIRRVALRGHASRDERDPPRLSQRRAEAVRAWLVAHGIEASRLTARGDGVGSPIADDATAEGRAHNRRVNIEVTEMGPAPPPPPSTRREVPAGCPDSPPPPRRGPCTSPTPTGDRSG